MKKSLLTVALIVLNTLAFFAGIYAAFNVAIQTPVDLLLGVLFLAVLPAPLVFVWGYLRDGYGFGRLKFFLCTLLPPFILSTAANIVMLILALTVGSQNGGYGGLALIALIMANCGATFVLTLAIVLWTTFCEFVKSDRARKVWAIVLLGVCGVIICCRLRGLLGLSYSGMVSIIYHDEREFIVTYLLGILRGAAIWAVPLGFGAAKLMKIYRDEYSLKPPLFMLLAFLPTILISGGIILARYSEFKEHFFTGFNFMIQLETAIFTVTLALASAIIYAVAALIRSKRHYY